MSNERWIIIKRCTPKSKKVYTKRQKGVHLISGRCTPFYNLRALVKENMSAREGKYERSFPNRTFPNRTFPLPLPFRTGRRMSVCNGELHLSPITLHLSAPALQGRDGEGLSPCKGGTGRVFALAHSVKRFAEKINLNLLCVETVS